MAEDEYGEDQGEDKSRKIISDDIEPEVQRRILEFFNKADRVEEIARVEGVPIKEGVAKRILDQKRKLGAFGFVKIEQLNKIRGLDLKIFGELVFRFGPAYYGQWIRPYATEYEDRTPYHVAHAAMLRTGLVLFLPESNTRTTLLWDPSDEVNPQFEFLVDDPDEKLFCSGHAFLSDGRLLVAGGGGGSPDNVNRAWKFDPVAKTWTRTAGDMNHARWYPTVVTLADERRVWVIGGHHSHETSEVYDEITDSFTLVTGPDAERAFPQTYPGLHLLPGGEIFYTRTGFGSAGQGPGGGDPVPGTPYFRFTTSPTTGEWVEIVHQMEHQDRVRGMSVILLDPCDPAVRVMIIGGSTMPASETAEIVNLSSLNPTWDHPTLIPGSQSRTNVNAVLLPDGTVLVVGGTTTPDPPCALYDPATDTWSSMAKVQYRKQYHSVALLLPSGKVMATGGSNYGGGSNVIEIFSPPYLFKGPRPQITVAPALVHHGQTMDVKTPQAVHIERVVLVRPIAVTHQTDSEQRVIQMPFSRKGNTLSVTAPDADHPHGLAPRGHYMLFILTDDGVPSDGQFIFLH